MHTLPWDWVMLSCLFWSWDVSKLYLLLFTCCRHANQVFRIQVTCYNCSKITVTVTNDPQWIFKYMYTVHDFFLCAPPDIFFYKVRNKSACCVKLLAFPLCFVSVDGGSGSAMSSTAHCHNLNQTERKGAGWDSAALWKKTIMLLIRCGCFCCSSANPDICAHW